MSKINENMLLIKNALDKLSCPVHGKKEYRFRVQTNYVVNFDRCCEEFEEEIRDTINRVLSSFNH